MNSEKPVVVRSVNMSGEMVCVDFFRRIDGTFGFEEFRRDPEDGQGWFAIGFYSNQSFGTLAGAEQAAEQAVGWLADAMRHRNRQVL